MSVGPVTLGARVADLEGVTAMQRSFTEPEAPGCIIGSLVTGGVSILSYDTVSYIKVTDRGIALTQEGVQVGDSKRFVPYVFGERASVQEGDYFEPVIVVDGPASEDYSYVRYLDDDGVVIAIYVVDGPGPLDEGCA